MSRTLILLIGVAFASVLGSRIVFEGGYRLTNEMALDISMNSSSVQSNLGRNNRVGFQVFYMNWTRVNQIREDPYADQEAYPANSSIWYVVWVFRDEGEQGALVVSQIIEDESGRILHEGLGGLR